MSKLTINELRILIREAITEAVSDSDQFRRDPNYHIAQQNREREEIEPDGFDEETFISDTTFLLALKKISNHSKTYNQMMSELLQMIMQNSEVEAVQLHKKILKKLKDVSIDIADATLSSNIEINPSNDYGNIMFVPSSLPALKDISTQLVAYLETFNQLMLMVKKRIRREPKTTSKTAGMSIYKLYMNILKRLEEIVKKISLVNPFVNIQAAPKEKI
jgi:hypothetical protein